MSDRAKARVYETGHTTEHDALVAEVHLPFNAVAQVSAHPDNNGFLIRVWGSNGTHEYGGDNMPFVSLSVTFDAQCEPELQHLRVGEG